MYSISGKKFNKNLSIHMWQYNLQQQPVLLYTISFSKNTVKIFFINNTDILTNCFTAQLFGSLVVKKKKKKKKFINMLQLNAGLVQ